VKGFMTAVMLYRLLYEHREKGQIVFLDDCDSIFWNEDALNILKAALDTVEHRIVSYRAMGDDDDIPSEFEFKGTMVFATNIDFYHYIKTAKNRVVEHIKALMSRVQYLPLKLHHPRAVVLWVSHMIRNNKMLQAHPHSLTAKQSEEVLTFLLENVDRIEPMVSLRTAVKCAEIVRMKGEGWQRLASFTILKG
jgi:GT2 family glycosyltransferase